jgi:hypothetical protein
MRGRESAKPVHSAEWLRDAVYLGTMKPSLPASKLLTVLLFAFFESHIDFPQLRFVKRSATVGYAN